MEKPRAVLFDAYGTLFDVYSVAMKAEQLFPGQGQLLAKAWRDKQIEYSRLLTTCNHGAYYEPFWSVTEKALRYAIKLIACCADSMPANGQFDLKNIDSAVNALMSQYSHLAAFPENREVLSELKKRGIVTGILSNGDPAMLDAAVKSAGLADMLDHVISVDSIRKYKTHPDAYALGSNATGLQAKQMLFVSSNGWDVAGAGWAGYRTIWVNRAGLPAEQIGPTPAHVGTSLRDIFHFLPPP